MAQVGSGILLGCYANSGSINGRIQFEFLSMNINFLKKKFFLIIRVVAERVCSFLYITYSKTTRKLTWKMQALTNLTQEELCADRARLKSEQLRESTEFLPLLESQSDQRWDCVPVPAT